MAEPHKLSIAAQTAAILTFMTLAMRVAAFAETVPPSSPQPGKCLAIQDDDARLGCIRNFLGKQVVRTPVLGDAWSIIRSSDPGGGKSIVSVARFADPAKSDPDLAGLMVRCQQPNKFDLLIAIVTPIPIRAKRKVLLATTSMSLAFEAESILPGSLLLLPQQAVDAVTTWEDQNDVTVSIKNPDGEIKGQVSLSGLSGALTKLSALCPAP